MTGNAEVGDRWVISDWGAMSPFGVGRAGFVAGLRAGCPTAAPLEADRWRAPDSVACLVPGFDVRTALGRKGTRAMDRATGLAISAVGDLLREDRCGPVGELSESTGIVLGTTMGSAESMMEFTRTSLTAAKPFHVDPADMPSAVMNCAAGHCAIWHRVKGPNATVAAGRASGLAALVYARRLLSNGRAARVICGAVEEYSPARSWLEFHTRGGAGQKPLSEGCVVVMLEPASGRSARRPALAEVIAVESLVATGADLGATVTRCVQRTLDRGGLAPQDIWAVVPGETGTPEAAREREVLGGLFAPDVFGQIPPVGVLGDGGAVSGMFQIAMVLGAAEATGRLAGRLALIASVDRDASVACAVLRLAGDPR